MLEVSVKFAKTPSNPFPPFLPAAFPEQLTGQMASAAKVCGGSAVSLRRSLNPFPSRVSFQGVEPPRDRFVPMAVLKRNPKRLKYSAPRFTKVTFFLSSSMFHSLCLRICSFFFWVSRASLRAFP